MPRYILYARKSSESEDRQVLSIDSQVAELRRTAQERGLELGATLTEARSAKAPGRPVFGAVLQRLARGQAEGILCWKLDRLARNPVDGGSVIWAFDQGKLREIVTPGRAYTDNANDKFFMSLEFGIAKKYVDDLSDNVKRGNRAKLAQGWLPGVPPVGYRNDLATKTIVPDLERFTVVRRMFDAVLKGDPIWRVLETATTAWGLRTPKFRRKGGGPVSRSTFYRMLSNPFYYGLIVRAGARYAGAHEPMLSKDEFDEIQALLGRHRAPGRKEHVFAYTGLLRCGACGHGVTAERKVNRYGSRYTYYRCAHRFLPNPCREPYLRDDRLEEQIVRMLGRLALPERHYAWSRERLQRIAKADDQQHERFRRSVEQALAGCQTRLERLTDLAVRELVGDEELQANRERILAEQLKLRRQLEAPAATSTKAVQLATRALDLAQTAKMRFLDGSVFERQQVLRSLTANFFLKGRILRTELQKPFSLMVENRDVTTWRANWDRVCNRLLAFFRDTPDAIQWPDYCRDESSPPTVAAA